MGRADANPAYPWFYQSRLWNHEEYEKSTRHFVQMNSLSDSMLITSAIILNFLIAAVPGFGI
jgi:hypothetical protein